MLIDLEPEILTIVIHKTFEPKGNNLASLQSWIMCEKTKIK